MSWLRFGALSCFQASTSFVRWLSVGGRISYQQNTSFGYVFSFPPAADHRCGVCALQNRTDKTNACVHSLHTVARKPEQARVTKLKSLVSRSRGNLNSLKNAKAEGTDEELMAEERCAQDGTELVCYLCPNFAIWEGEHLSIGNMPRQFIVNIVKCAVDRLETLLSCRDSQVAVVCRSGEVMLEVIAEQTLQDLRVLHPGKVSMLVGCLYSSGYTCQELYGRVRDLCDENLEKWFEDESSSFCLAYLLFIIKMKKVDLLDMPQQLAMAFKRMEIVKYQRGYGFVANLISHHKCLDGAILRVLLGDAEKQCKSQEELVFADLVDLLLAGRTEQLRLVSEDSMEIFCCYLLKIKHTADAHALVTLSELAYSWCGRSGKGDMDRVNLLAKRGVFAKVKEELAKKRKEYLDIRRLVWFLRCLAGLKQLDLDLLTESAQVLMDSIHQLTLQEACSVLFIYGSQKEGLVKCVPDVLAKVSNILFSASNKLYRKAVVSKILLTLAIHRVYVVNKADLVRFVKDFALSELSANMSWSYADDVAFSAFVLDVKWPPLASALVQRAKEAGQSSALELHNVCRYAALCGTSLVEVCDLLPSLVDKFDKETDINFFRKCEVLQIVDLCKFAEPEALFQWSEVTLSTLEGWKISVQQWETHLSVSEVWQTVQQRLLSICVAVSGGHQNVTENVTLCFLHVMCSLCYDPGNKKFVAMQENVSNCMRIGEHRVVRIAVNIAHERMYHANRPDKPLGFLKFQEKVLNCRGWKYITINWAIFWKVSPSEQTALVQRRISECLGASLRN